MNVQARVDRIPQEILKELMRLSLEEVGGISYERGKYLKFDKSGKAQKVLEYLIENTIIDSLNVTADCEKVQIYVIGEEEVAEPVAEPEVSEYI